MCFTDTALAYAPTRRIRRACDLNAHSLQKYVEALNHSILPFDSDTAVLNRLARKLHLRKKALMASLLKLESNLLTRY